MGGRGSRAAALAVLCVALSACTPLFRNHGYAPSESELADLTLGVDTRDSVVAAVGRPTAGGVLDGQGFYYVQSRFRHLAFLEPREVEREVLALSFAADGTLAAVERFGLEDGRAVPLSRRTTDRIFADLTLINQLLGNVGRVDAGALVGDE